MACIARKHSPLSEIDKTLAKAGISAEALDRVRLAQGVVGKTSYVIAAAIFALAVVAFSLKESSYLFGVAIILLLIVVFYICSILWFAHKHPGESLLEGAELIKWRQLDIAAKNIPPDILQEDRPARISPDQGH
jgi:hypothetical protein